MDSEQPAAHPIALGELHDNDLAVSTQAVWDRIRPHVGTLLLVAAAAFAALAAWTLVRSQRTSEQAAAWDGFITAFAEGDAGGLDTVMSRYAGSPAAQWAAIVQGDAALSDGNRLLLTDPTQARGRLEAAADRYAAVAAERPSGLAAQRAVFGLARARESLGQLDEAARGYQALVAEYPESPFVPMAEERVAALSRPATREWYKWFQSRPASGAESTSAAESSDAPAPPASTDAAPAG